MFEQFLEVISTKLMQKLKNLRGVFNPTNTII